MESFATIEIWLPVLSALIPILTALAVKSSGDSHLRALIAAGAAVVLAVIHEVTEAPSFTIEGLVVVAITALVVQVGTYLSVWKPLANVNETVLPNVGIGS